MADITKFLFMRHLRTNPTTHVRHLRNGKLVHDGVGQAFWFRALSAALSEVPVDDREQALHFHGRTHDFQDVVVQATVTYRVADPAVAVTRVDFGVDPDTGSWEAMPLDQLGSLLTELAQQHALAVGSERAIAENELQSQIELTRREEELVDRRGHNERKRATEAAAANRIEAEAQAERRRLLADAEAGATRAVGLAEADAEAARLAAYREFDSAILLGLAVRELAANLPQIVIAVGQDGLVANVAKYLDGQVVIGVNPEPDCNPGVLALHHPEAVATLVQVAADARGGAAMEARTMVQATTDDGQTLLALNEIYVGHPSHQSARYRIDLFDGSTERQSSSGLLIGTGTGSTGWCRSAWLERRSELRLPDPAEPSLCWFVREAWPSPATGTHLTEGIVGPDDDLVVVAESDLVVFGDGIESDAISLSWGQRATISVAGRRLRLLGRDPGRSLLAS